MVEQETKEHAAIESAANKAASENQSEPNKAIDAFDAYKAELENSRKHFEQVRDEARQATEKLQRMVAMAEVRGKSFAGQEPKELTQQEKVKQDVQSWMPKSLLPRNLQ